MYPKPDHVWAEVDWGLARKYEPSEWAEAVFGWPQEQVEVCDEPRERRGASVPPVPRAAGPERYRVLEVWEP